VPDEFSRYDVYATAGSPYCYTESSVLKNKLGIRDGKKLKDVEADVSLIRQNEMMSHPVVGRFTVHHLCRIHQKLLGDIYSFAGHFRTEDISKGDTRFLSHAEISSKLSALLQQLHREGNLTQTDFETMIPRAAYFMAELNYIHPFREGNGRAIREFMRLLLLNSHYTVDWSCVPTEELMQAMVESVYDTAPLIDVLKQCVQPRK